MPFFVHCFSIWLVLHPSNIHAWVFELNYASIDDFSNILCCSKFKKVEILVKVESFLLVFFMKTDEIYKTYIQSSNIFNHYPLKFSFWLFQILKQELLAHTLSPFWSATNLIEELK